MKIFLDTADIDQIIKYSYIIDGVTTNPTLIARTGGCMTFEELVDTITRTVPGPISVEVVSPEADQMVEEAKRFSRISPSIVIKVPMTPEGLKATKILSRQHIKTNVTLVFSANQALLAANCGATYVSIFVGRLDDIGHCGMDVVRDTAEIFAKHAYPSHIITASIRHPMHVLEAAKAGSHVATIPPSVLDLMAKHNLTDKGIELFMNDWKKVIS